jgi:hypothetical protein
VIRGTSEQFQFKIPYKYEDVQFVEITFWQDDVVGTMDSPFPIKKHLSACEDTTGTNVLILTLQPNETLRFTDKKKAYVQLSGCTLEGSMFSSRKSIITVYPTYVDNIFDTTSPPMTEDGWLIVDGGSIVDDSGEIVFLDGGAILQRIGGDINGG